MVYAKFGGQTECIMGNWKIENWWDELREAGPPLGYYPNSKKCWLVVKPEKEGRAKEMFAGTGINTTTGANILALRWAHGLILSNMWVAR